MTVPALDTAGAATTVTFTPRSTTSLRFTVTGVSAATANAGLAEIETYGYTTSTATPTPTDADPDPDDRRPRDPHSAPTPEHGGGPR